MFVDASAICAIMLREPGFEALIERLKPGAVTSPLALYEATLAIGRVKQGGIAAARRDVARFAAETGMSLSDIGPADYEAALDAFERYGKGRRPARLNMGDCFAYACARIRGLPLLFKGDDFSQTDIPAA